MTTTNPTEEVERAILTSLLADPTYLPELDGLLEPGDFTPGPRRAVFEALQNLHLADEPIDLVTIREELKRVVPGASTASALAKLATGDGSPSHLHNYVERLRAVRTIERLQDVVSETAGELRACKPDHDAISTIVTDASVQMDALAAKVERHKDFNLNAELARAFEEMQSEEPAGIESGIYKLDDMLHGLRPGKLIVLAGRPGMGKSAFALTLARLIARRGKHTLYFSMEMLRDELVQRMLAAEADVDLSRIIGRTLDDEEIARIRTAVQNLRHQPITVFDSQHIGIPFLRASLRRALRLGRVDCVMVDYLQIMHSSAKAEARHLEIGMYSRELKALSMEFQLPVIALAQLSRAVDARANSDPPCEPRLSDLRESGSIEQDADSVGFLYRRHAYDPGADEKDAELIIAKNRGGRCGRIRLFWRPTLTRFDNVDEHTVVNIP